MQPAAANPILTIPDGTMSSKGDELYDKRFRERYVVLETARASGGELVRVETPPHPGRTDAQRAPIQASASGSRCSPGPWS